MVAERQREYETIYILRPGADEDDAAKARERVEQVLETEGGHLLRFDDWGLRKLAYEIRDRTESTYHERGKYQYYRYMAPNVTVAEIERNLRILDPVIKYMTVKLDDNLIPTERIQAAEAQVAADAAAEEEE